MAVGLRDRVRTILTGEQGDEEERVHRAIDEIAGDVDRVSHRLAVIDPEWELIARQPIDEAKELLQQ